MQDRGGTMIPIIRQITVYEYLAVYLALATSIYYVIRLKQQMPKEQTPVQVLDFTYRVVRYKRREE